MSNIIRGEKIGAIATLTSSKVFHYSDVGALSSSVVDEECKRAFQQGRLEGEKKGYEQAQNELRILVNLIQTLTLKLLEHKERLLEQLKPEVIEFAFSVCERVIRKELGNPETLVKLINTLLSSAASSFRHDTLQIILSPEDLMMLEDHLSQIHYDKREIEGVRFRADALMRRGDCRLETPTGLLNYTISRELAELQARVLQR